MDITKYLLGKGVDVSRQPILKNCKHFFIEPNNLYFHKKIAPFESLDFVYSKNLINETKFFRILIKEWFYLCRVGGKITSQTKCSNFATNWTLSGKFISGMING